MQSIESNQRHSCVLRLAALAVLSLAAAACGSDTAKPAPTVTSTVPADAATGIGTGSAVSVVFKSPMAPLTATSFLIKQGATAVPGAVSMSADNLTATFTPNSSLAANTGYTATIPAGTKSAAGGSLAADKSWSFTTAASAGPPSPALVSSSPSDGATSVPLNAKLSATFDMPMAPLSGAIFTLVQGSTAVAGSVSASADNMSAIFAPTANLAANLPYTATITGGAVSAGGVAIAGPQTFSFTTGATVDTAAPVVSSTSPAANDGSVATNARVSVTFSKAMDAQTITSSSFTVSQGSTTIPGSVVYGPAFTATFRPSNPLPTNATLTAALTTALKDLQGNALASAFTWTFTTANAAARGPAPVGLGTAGNFAILAKTAISTGPASAITGDIAVSPAAASYLTGFSLVADSTNVFSTSPQITGKAYAANYAVPTPSNLTTAVGNMQSAYTDAASRPTPDFLELGSGNIGGKTLSPGLYKWTSTVTIPADVTISGGANDVWIFQTTGDITMAAAQHVVLSGGALARNVFWQVAGKVTLGAGAHFEGIVLCKTQVTLQTSASLNGRILSQTAVALDHATVVRPL